METASSGANAMEGFAASSSGPNYGTAGSAAGISGTGNGTFHYVVYAVRDALHDHQPVEENSLYRPEILARGRLLDSLPAAMRADLIKNGTLNADGTYNQSAATRLGWTIPPPATVNTAPPVLPTK